MQGKMAIVGSGQSVTLFKAAGVAAFSAENEKKAKELIRFAAKDYSIIFVTEDLAKQLADFLKVFDEAPYPVILTIPTGDGKSDYSYQMLKNAMERALGVDILFDKN
jgi:V/A-type H+-transporting ATPase subunit F